MGGVADEETANQKALIGCWFKKSIFGGRILKDHSGRQRQKQGNDQKAIAVTQVRDSGGVAEVAEVEGQGSGYIEMRQLEV